MNMHDEDCDLREAFARLRREERARVTPFPEVLRIAQRRRAERRWPMRVPAMVAVVAALGVLAARQAGYFDPSPRVAGSLASWVAPTEFLLRTPGEELLSGTPAFARDPPAMFPIDRRDTPDPHRS